MPVPCLIRPLHGGRVSMTAPPPTAT